MDLTEKEIRFIHDYLTRHGVTQYELQAELLDHIANAVKDRMAMGQTFEQALWKVHLGFGNKPRSKRLNKARTQWIVTESLYADSSGFKKIMRDKHRELTKGLRKKMRQTLIDLFKHPGFLFAYLGLGALCLQPEYLGLSRNQIKQAVFFGALFLAAFPMALSLWSWISPKKRSYGRTLSAHFPSLFLGFFNLFMFFPVLDKESENGTLWLFLFFVILFPVLIAELRLFLSEWRRTTHLKNLSA